MQIFILIPGEYGSYYLVSYIYIKSGEDFLRLTFLCQDSQASLDKLKTNNPGFFYEAGAVGYL